ncbi:hypothetical protein PUN4_130213 [Paraburkholderia unamae]|nr:hypothetical protein PUN4_130213 [Paraburkholderia unamae]
MGRQTPPQQKHTPAKGCLPPEVAYYAMKNEAASPELRTNNHHMQTFTALHGVADAKRMAVIRGARFRAGGAL